MDEVKRFIVDCLTRVGAPENHASAMADVLAEADRRGHYSHGLNRLEWYVRDVGKNLCDPSATPTLIQETLATAWVDGNNGFGPVVGNFCMQLAISKARECGVGWVVAKGSNHFGIAGWYSMQALEHNFLGMSFTNTSPVMFPTRSKQPGLGTNPLSLAAAGKDGDSFVLDMAATTVAMGKVEVLNVKNEPLPEGWALDPEGRPTTDAAVALKPGSGLTPLGGAEDTSGYKGYGLALMVEVLTGILGGSAYGSNIHSWAEASSVADLGQCFVAVDPACFAPGFEDRLSDFIHQLKNLPPVDTEKPVLVAGDPERMHEEKVQKEEGILYHISQLDSLENLAKRLGVTPLIAIHSHD